MLGNRQFTFEQIKNSLSWACVRVMLAYTLCCLWGVPAAATDLRVTGVSLAVGEQEDTLVLQMSRPTVYKAFLLDNPKRLVVDLPPFDWHVSPQEMKAYGGELVTNVRYARFDASTSRIVFDLSVPIALQAETAPTEPSSELKFYLVHKGAAAKRRSDSLETRHQPNAHVEFDNSQRDPVFDVTPVPAQKPDEVTKEKPLIMIDAGHGGQDPGTIGRHATKEKHITLRYAKELKRALEASGLFRAVLTRPDDRFIRLRERIAIAKRAGAHLFLSLHADSAPSMKAQGLSVYTLSEEASDAEAAALAEKENMSDIIAGVDLGVEDEDVAGILIDLVQRDTKNKSIQLAENLVGALQRQRITLLPNTHRFAGFAVLKSPDIPSALVEIGFLSHPQEEALIKSSRHRAKVIEGIVNGVIDFFRLR